jgi:DNA-binding CsgD family transcriptional regulator
VFTAITNHGAHYGGRLFFLILRKTVYGVNLSASVSNFRVAYLKEAFRNFGESVLTPREQEITKLLLKGFSAKSIAGNLGISSGTVRNHMKQVYSKLGVNSQVELAGLFFEMLGVEGSDAG